MKVVVAEKSSDLATTAADLVHSYLCSTDLPVLGLATGASVHPLYHELIRRHREGSLSFGTTRAFLLDEYLGLNEDHPQLYRNVIHRDLLAHVDIEPDNLHAPDISASALDRECHRYDELVRRSRIGLQILGMGRNGHLAFNEPGSPFDSRTRIVRLAASTRRDNARFFDSPDEVPYRALTQGLGTIMQSGHLLVIAVGSSKAPAVRASLKGPATPKVPASVVRIHPQASVMVDTNAARSETF